MAVPPQFGERQFTVDKSPSDKDTLTNCAIVAVNVLPGIKHIVLRNIAGLERYFSVREKHGVKENSIGLGKKQREWAGVQIADRVIVRPYDASNKLGSITVELNFLDAGPKKAPAPFDTEKMHSDFKMKDFTNQVFAKNQPFFYQTEGKPILLARVTGLEVLDPSVLKAKKPSGQSVAQDHGVLELKTEVFFERAKSHSELASLWAIGQKLWNKQYSEVYVAAQDTAWPPHIAPIVSALVSSLQSRLLDLVGKAYSVIKVDAVLELTGLTEDQLSQEASSRQWQVDSAKGTITISRQESDPQGDTNAKEVLGRLTKAVSFLEC